MLYMELILVDVKDWVFGEGPMEEVTFAGLSYQSSRPWEEQVHEHAGWEQPSPRPRGGGGSVPL